VEQFQVAAGGLQRAVSGEQVVSQPVSASNERINSVGAILGFVGIFCVQIIRDELAERSRLQLLRPGFEVDRKSVV
jgi:hypothetical protein